MDEVAVMDNGDDEGDGDEEKEKDGEEEEEEVEEEVGDALEVVVTSSRAGLLGLLRDVSAESCFCSCCICCSCCWCSCWLCCCCCCCCRCCCCCCCCWLCCCCCCSGFSLTIERDLCDDGEDEEDDEELVGEGLGCDDLDVTCCCCCCCGENEVDNDVWVEGGRDHDGMETGSVE